MYLKLRINIFAHCWDKRSFITVSAKTWQGETTQVSKIVRGLMSWENQIAKTLITLKLIERVLDIMFHVFSVGF